MDQISPVAAALSEAVADIGRLAASDPGRVRGLLSDALGSRAREYRAEVDAIVIGAEEDVPRDLLARRRGEQGADDAALSARLAGRGLAPDMASFVVGAWSAALSTGSSVPGPLPVAGAAAAGAAVLLSAADAATPPDPGPGIPADLEPEASAPSAAPQTEEESAASEPSEAPGPAAGDDQDPGGALAVAGALGLAYGAPTTPDDPAPAAEPGADVTLPAPAPTLAAVEPEPGGRRGAAVAIGVAVLLLVLLTGTAVALTRSNGDPGATPSATTSATQTPDDPSPDPPTPTPTEAVPKVAGLSIAAATKALTEAGFTVTKKTEKRDGKVRVVSVSPAAGTPLALGSTVVLTVSDGRTTVPNVYGLSESTAVQKLKAAGFKVFIRRALSDKPTGTVIGQSPQPEKRAATGSTVTVTIDKAAPPPPPPPITPTPTPSCDPICDPTNL